jgi:hypothetical protein
MWFVPNTITMKNSNDKKLSAAKFADFLMVISPSTKNEAKRLKIVEWQAAKTISWSTSNLKPTQP